MLLRRLRTFVLVSAAFPLCIFSSKALAETFTVHGSVSLNTNYKFRQIDGQPRMSIYQTNPNDKEQQFDRIEGNLGGTLLKHRFTGKCLNAYRKYNGAEINVWPCDPNDGDQNFVISDIGNGEIELKLANTNFCVDVPSAQNEGKVYLWECHQNTNQRFKSNAISSAPVSSPDWKLPWPKGITGKVTQGWHSGNAIDISLKAGVAVLAPVDSKVLWSCNAGNNHLAIKFQSLKDGNIYKIFHVNSTSVTQGKVYKQGEQIGVVAGDRPWNDCAKSTGPHLHFVLPSKNFTVGNYKFTPSSIPSSLTSQN